MTDMDALFDSRAEVTAGDNQIKSIASLIRDERQANSDMETAESMLASAKERRTELRNKLIPEAMLDAGMREFTTEEGFKAKVVFLTDGSLGSPKTEEERRVKEEKLDCLIAHGGGEIVKQTVTLEFPKELAAEAEAMRIWLTEKMEERKLPVTVSRERNVHHQTLGSWVRERMASGDVEDHLPPAFFEKMGLWYGEGAKITVPKAKK